MSKRDIVVRCVAAAVLIVICAGCGGIDQFIGGIGAQHGSYDVTGERVEMRMLTLDEMKGLSTAPEHIAVDTSYLEAQLSGGQAGLIDLGIPQLVKFGYQVVEQEIKNEEGRYEQQFGTSAFAPGFWLDQNSMRYAGFILRRHTAKEKDGKAKPAFVLVCGFIPLQKQRFVEIVPLYLDIQRPKAKMAGDYDLVKVTIAVKSQWSDDKGYHDDTMSTINWQLSGGYDLNGEAQKFNYLTSGPHAGDPKVLTGPQFAGAFAAPQRDSTADASGNLKQDSSGGLPTFAVTIDEKDPTEAQQLTKLVETFVESTDKSNNGGKSTGTGKGDGQTGGNGTGGGAAGGQ